MVHCGRDYVVMQGVEYMSIIYSDIIQVNFVKLSIIIYKIQFGEGLQDSVWRRFTRYSLEKVYKIQFGEGLQDTVRRRFTRFSLEKVYKIQFGEGLQDTVWRRFTRFSLEKVCKIHFRENLQETALTRFTRYSSEEVYKIKFGTVYRARTIHKTIAFFSLKFQPNLEIEINKV